MLHLPIRAWRRLNTLRFIPRVVAKCGLFVFILLLIMFPYPNLLVRHINHQLHAETLIRPDAPALAPLLDRLRAEINPADPAKAQLRKVQAFVERAVPYAFDWDVWGTLDYLPTVEEVMAKGREDCDGRAVIAASLLRGLGYEAHLAANPLHVWVWTPEGETMSPQKDKLVDVTAKGWRIDWRGLRVIPEGFAFGVSVFPIVRELILAAAVWALLVTPRTRMLPAGITAALFVAGLLLLRASGAHVPGTSWSLFAAALAAIAAGFVTAIAARSPSAPHSEN